MHFIVTLRDEDGSGDPVENTCGVFHTADEAIAAVRWRAKLTYRQYFHRYPEDFADRGLRDAAWLTAIAPFSLYNLLSGVLTEDGAVLLGTGAGVFAKEPGLDRELSAEFPAAGEKT